MNALSPSTAAYPGHMPDFYRRTSSDQPHHWQSNLTRASQGGSFSQESKPKSWMDQVVSQSRQSFSKDERPSFSSPDASNRNNIWPVRQATYNLRNDGLSAIVDEDDDDLLSPMNPLSRTNTVWAEPELRSIWRTQSLGEAPPVKHERRKVDSPQQDLALDLERMQLAARHEPMPRNRADSLSPELSARVPPRGTAFPAEVLRKVQPWEPTYTQADFRDHTASRYLHTANSCFAVVEFKLFRADIYQMRLDWGISEGVSLVHVEADRGTDLGKVYFVTSDIEEARTVKKRLYRKHWDALLKHSRFVSQDHPKYEQAFNAFYHHVFNSTHATGFNGSASPKSITSQAVPQEMEKLQNKEGHEEKAKRDCQKKAQQLNLDIEILGAEFQHDMQKLTLYYMSPRYIHYQALQNEIYKMYKCRLWFTALNPVSFFPTRNDPAGRRKSGDWHAGAVPGLTPSPVNYADPSQINIVSGGFLPRDYRNDSMISPVAVQSPWNTSPPQTAFSQLDYRQT